MFVINNNHCQNSLLKKIRLIHESMELPPCYDLNSTLIITLYEHYIIDFNNDYITTEISHENSQILNIYKENNKCIEKITNKRVKLIPQYLGRHNVLFIFSNKCKLNICIDVIKQWETLEYSSVINYPKAKNKSYDYDSRSQIYLLEKKSFDEKKNYLKRMVPFVKNNKHIRNALIDSLHYLLTQYDDDISDISDILYDMFKKIKN